MLELGILAIGTSARSKDKEGREEEERGERGALERCLLCFQSLLLSPWAGEREAGEEMGEMVVAGYGMDKALRTSVSFDTPCGALLRELEVRFSPRSECTFGCLFAAALIFLFLRIIWQWSESKDSGMRCFLVSEEFAASFFFQKNVQSCRFFPSFRDSDIFIIFQDTCL